MPPEKSTPTQSPVLSVDASPSPSRKQPIETLLETFPSEIVFVQCLISPKPNGFELRHAQDRSVPISSLKGLVLEELRSLAQFNAQNAFRPLKAAPDLRNGWSCIVSTPADLERALDLLYPGCLTDWFEALAPNPPTTSYEAFTSRQTGMYRSAQRLAPLEAKRVTTACCAPGFCLKRRLWCVSDLPPDAPNHKSIAPCLEPCSILLELARKTNRLLLEDKDPCQLGISDWTAIKEALQLALNHPPEGLRSGDLSAPLNPRRIQALLERLEIVAVEQPAAPSAES